jgi:hypothetical protein
MKKNQTNELVMELMSDSIFGNINVLLEIANRHGESPELLHQVMSLKQSMETMSLVVEYLLFDLEATNREFDKLRTIIGEKE